MLIKRKKIPVRDIITIGILPSFLKTMVYRIKGYKIGKNVSFSFGSVIIGNNVSVGDNSSFGFISVVRGNTIKIDRYVTIGSLSMIDTENIIIGEDSRINENVIIGGIKTPESLIKIGKRAIIMEYSFINPTKPIIIGDDTGIGGHCLLFTHGSWLNQLDGFPVTFAPITIGNNVWLPWRVFIMPGIEIGNNVVIGANSLINKNIQPNVLVAGSPAKVLAENYPSPISDLERKTILDRILSEFYEHLRYHSFNVKITMLGKNTKVEIDGKNKSEIYIINEKQNISFSSGDNLLIIDSEVAVKPNHKMSIDLLNKTRVGHSNVGEEFVKFISRYGIRFDRLD